MGRSLVKPRALVAKAVHGSGPVEVSMKRRVAASAAMLGTAGTFGWLAWTTRHFVTDWTLVGFAGVVGAAAIGISRKSLIPQLASRALGWAIFVPAAMWASLSTLGGHADKLGLVMALTSGASLFLARPLLSTKEAYEKFAPTSFRNWFLGAATAMTGLAGIFGLMAYEMMRPHSFGSAILAGLTSLTLAGSVVGVLRMRAWGVLLAIASSLGMLMSMPFMDSGGAFGMFLAALPGLLMGVPVAVAMRDRAKGERVRVATPDLRTEAEALPSRVRIATDSDELLEEERPLEPPRQAAAMRI